MKKFEILAFANMAIGTQFFDPVAGENFRKVSATQAEFLTGAEFKGARADFPGDNELEAKTPIGYQFADASGANIQGDDNDPSGYASFEILGRDLAQLTINANPGAGLQLFAIYPGDIENPAHLE